MSERERLRSAVATALRDGDLTAGLAGLVRLRRADPDEVARVVTIAVGVTAGASPDQETEPDDAALTLLNALDAPGTGVPPDDAAHTAAQRRARGLSLMAAGRWGEATETWESLSPRDARSAQVLAECRFRARRGDDLLGMSGVVRGRRYFQGLELIRRAEYRRAARVLGAGADRSAGGRSARALADLGRLRARAAVVDGTRLDDDVAVPSVEHRPDLSVVVDALALRGADRSQEAIELLRADLRRRPHARRTAHALAVFAFHHAAASGGPDHSGWALCTAAWALVLADPAFWPDFRDRAAARYGVAVPDDVLNRASGAAETRLTDAPERCGTPGFAARVTRELRAARALARHGGLRPAPDAPPVAPSPFGVRELGLTDLLVARLRELDVAGDPGAGELRTWFSGIGVAKVLLGDGEYAKAEDELVDLRCSRCRPPGRRRPSGVVVCAVGCPTVARRHPGYADPATGPVRLRTDARDLLAEVHVERGRVALEDGDPGSARRFWTTALGETGNRAGVRRAVADAVLTVTDRSGVDDSVRTEALDTYVALGGSSADGEDAARIVGELARALNERGVRRHEAEPPDLRGAVADLRRAADLNPYVMRFLLNLVVATQSLAGVRVYGSGEVVEGLQLCIDVRARMRRIPARSADETERADLEKTIGAFVDELVDRTCDLAHTLSPTEARRLLDDVLRRLPRNVRLREAQDRLGGRSGTEGAR